PEAVSLEERLLRGPEIRPVESAAACHAAHAEDLQLLLLAAELYLGFVPVDLGFLTPRVGLRNEGLFAEQPQLRLPGTDIPAYCRLGDRVTRELRADPRIDPVSRVALLSRRPSVCLQDAINEGHDRGQARAGTLRSFPLGWKGALERLTHHSPVYAELTGNAL